MDTEKKNYWFKSNKYGFGWYPSSWQGWLVMILYLALLIHSFISFDRHSSSVFNFLLNILPVVVVATLMLMWIVYAKGERPPWNIEVENRY